MNMNLLEDRDTVFYVLSTCLSKNNNITKYDGDFWENKEDAFKALLELYKRNLFDKNDKDVFIMVWEIDEGGNDCIGYYYIEDVIAYFGMQTMSIKKYVVVCYSVHNKEIASYDAFDNEEDAYNFLEKDAQNTYEEETNNLNDEEKEKIDFTISDDGTAYLSSYDGEYEWTWEVIQIR